MTCNNCEIGVLEPVDVPEPTESGSFTEHYQCANCKANLYVSGKEQEPAYKWKKWGSAV